MRQQRERREAATAHLAPHGLSLLNITRHFLKEQEREEKAALRDRQWQLGQTERLRRLDTPPPAPTVKIVTKE